MVYVYCIKSTHRALYWDGDRFSWHKKAVTEEEAEEIIEIASQEIDAIFGTEPEVKGLLPDEWDNLPRERAGSSKESETVNICDCGTFTTSSECFACRKAKDVSVTEIAPTHRGKWGASRKAAFFRRIAELSKWDRIKDRMSK